MPYIKVEDRKRIVDTVEKGDRNRIEAVADRIKSEGDLNYVITYLCHLFIKAKGKRYATLNTVVGVLECAKQELYRRVIAPYENLKIESNGDVE